MNMISLCLLLGISYASAQGNLAQVAVTGYSDKLYR